MRLFGSNVEVIDPTTTEWQVVEQQQRAPVQVQQPYVAPRVTGVEHLSGPCSGGGGMPDYCLNWYNPDGGRQTCAVEEYVTEEHSRLGTFVFCVVAVSLMGMLIGAIFALSEAGVF